MENAKTTIKLICLIYTESNIFEDFLVSVMNHL